MSASDRTRHAYLTDLVVRQEKPDPNRRTEVYDTGCPGLRLLIQPSGKLSWIMRFRRPVKSSNPKHVGGAVVKLTLGPYKSVASPARPEVGEAMTLGEARAVAMEINRRRAAGEDVYATERRKKLARTRPGAGDAIYNFEKAATDFVERYSRRKSEWGWEKTAALLGLRYPKDGGKPSIIEGRPCYVWRGHPVDAITRADVKALVDPMFAETPAMAHATFSALNSMFVWLMKDEAAIDASPLATIRRPEYKVKKDARVLSGDEIKKFWDATAAEDQPFRDGARVLLLTAQRRAEVRGMRWDELDNPTNPTEWTIPRQRMKVKDKRRKPHVVPIAPAVAKIICEVRRIAHSPYVFTIRGRRPIDFGAGYKDRIDSRMGDGVPPWTNHDLRHTARTVMTDHLDVRLPIAEAVIDHIQPGIAAVYDHSEYKRQKRDALERWAEYVEKLAGKKKDRRGN